MFSRLPESNAARQRRTGGAVVSTVLHFVVLALAVRATSGRADPAPKQEPIAPTIWVAPPDQPKQVDGPRSGGPPTSSHPTIAPVPSEKLTVPDFNVVGIPDPTPSGDPFVRAGDFTAKHVGSPLGSSEPTAGLGDEPLTDRVVDKVILALPGTSPRYPSMLQSAGVEGDVRAQFVVDTLGRVERGSIRVLETTHDLFGASVRDALLRARFTPAEAGGRKVRQLAEQVFTFRITK